jgi:hypothetical protein
MASTDVEMGSSRCRRWSGVGLIRTKMPATWNNSTLSLVELMLAISGMAPSGSSRQLSIFVRDYGSVRPLVRGKYTWTLLILLYSLLGGRNQGTDAIYNHRINSRE